MNKTTRRVAIVGSVRTPFVKSFNQYMGLSTQDLMTAPTRELLKRFNLVNKQIDFSAMGAVMKSAADFNLCREVLLEAGAGPTSPGVTVQMACGTGLEAAGQMAARIALGQIDIALAGGVDTNSDIPVSFSKRFSDILLRSNAGRSTMEKLKPWFGLRFKDLLPRVPSIQEPRTGKSMGDHTELMAQEWKISRASQDQLAFQSHQNAAKAYDEGFHSDLVMQLKGLSQDTILRSDTTVEKLAKLKPAFEKSAKGTLTAGNSTPLSDGASVVLLCSEERAKKEGWPVLAWFEDVEVSGVDHVGGEGLLMAPTVAVSRMIQRNNMKLQDFDVYEIHEAFAAQVLCTLAAWESDEYCKKRLGLNAALGSIDRSKMNLKGGSLALGHPFAATGGRILGSLAKQLHGSEQVGLISICAAGGMGITAIVKGNR